MQVLEIDPLQVLVRQGLDRLREELGNVEDLAKSIKEKGQIHPILLTDKLELIAGGRRLAACMLLKQPVKYIIRENTSDIELRELELEENLMRKDLTWQERVRGIAELDRLKKAIYGEAKPGPSQKGWSITDTAELAGINRHRAHEVITLDKAMQAFPEIAEATSERDAKKMLAKIEEKILLAELQKRKKATGTSPSMFADQCFIIKDALEGMAALKAESVGFANVDTPYGIDLTSKKKIQTSVRTDADYTEWEGIDYPTSIKLVSKEVFRILKPDSWMIFWFGIEWYEEVRETLVEAGFAVDKIPGVWFGGSGGAQTMQPEINLARSYDTFMVARKGKPIIMKRGHINVFAYDKVPPQNKIHPTEKPLPLMQEIWDVFVVPGTICLSPFLGSGNDLRAAFSRGCHAFGFELDENLKNKFLLRVEEDVKNKIYGGE